MKFNVGDRVKVHRGGRAPFKGKIDAITGDTSIQVIGDGFYSVHEDAPFHPRQLVRLRPKQVKEKGARTFWVTPRNIEDAVKEIENEKEVAWAAVVFNASLKKEAGYEVCLRELRKGDLITSEEKIKAAWVVVNKTLGLGHGTAAAAADIFLKALNLPPSEGE
jgi:hypothetical protein